MVKLDYAANIRMARAFLKLSTFQLAEKVGVSQATICNYENGKTIPRVDIWNAIMDLKSRAMETDEESAA